MGNLYEYLEWRGDISMEEVPLGEVDGLILSLLSYVDLDGILPHRTDDANSCMTVREVAKEYFFVRDPEEVRPLGLIVPTDILRLFRRMADTVRFGSLRLHDYVNEISEERETQFAALTVILPQEDLLVAYRGTDDTIVGWREDFNLSYMDEVPAQRRAADYLSTLDPAPESRVYVGGHSKGGNLAVWGAVHACERVRRHIERIWSYDGPGFTERFLASASYMSIADRISTIVPDSSLIGLLLGNDGNYSIIKSSRRGLHQHDGLTWEVSGARFIRTDVLSKRGRRTDTVVRARIDAMSREEKRTFTRLMFGVLESTGAKTLTELYRDGFRSALSMLRTVSTMTRDEQDTAAYLWGKLFDAKPLAEAREASGLQGKRRIHVEWGAIRSPKPVANRKESGRDSC